MKHLLALVSITLCGAVALNADDPRGAFLKQYCAGCHTGPEPKGDLRLDSSLPIKMDADNLTEWQKVIDRVAAGEMPPEDERQPSQQQRQQFIESLKKQVAASATAPPTVLRRLNRIGFRNSLRDLLRLPLHVDDPTEAFPADDKEDGFDNLGATLQMSDFLLRQYLKVVRTVVDRATFTGEMPEAKTFSLNDAKSRPLNFKSVGKLPDRDYAVLYLNDERAPGDPRGQQLINCREGAAHDGWYEFVFEVQSLGRGNFARELHAQKRDDYQVYFPEDLHRFEIYLTAPSQKSQVQTRPRILMDAIDLPDGERTTIRRRYWMPKQWRLEVAFGNGYATSSATSILRILDPEFDLDALSDLDRRKQREITNTATLDLIEKHNAPRIVVHNITETGPLYDRWPPESHTVVYGEPEQSLSDHLSQFATRAFRRPVSQQQLAPYIRLARKSPEGVRSAIEAILCSPRFVYLREDFGQIDAYAIASRLSYFLWNTIPDRALLRDAESGQLTEAKNLERHVDRMLSDPRSDEFVHAFLWGWLGLDNTVEMAPDPMKFYDFHRSRIDVSMVKETTAYFRYLLTENLPVEQLIASDYAFLNADLARHYRLDLSVETTATLQRVALKGHAHRGGLLGQASVLTASANGIDTSPVVRGIWILENLLGTPPSPPPPGVEVPEPDARGELSIRQLYAKHRTVESCNACHKKIDPLGFSLENFDATGVWRTRYESGHPIDASGTMPDGQAFRDIDGLKQIMIRDMDQFTTNLTRRLLTYATGRKMTVADRPEIDAISRRLDDAGGGLRDLIKLVVTSEIFR